QRAFRQHEDVGRLLRAPVQLPRDQVFRHQGREDRPGIQGNDRAGRHGAHPAQRIVRSEIADQRVPRRIQGRGHPAHRAVHRHHLRHSGSDAQGRRRIPRHARHLFRSHRRARTQSWRGRAAAGEEQDPDRCGPGNQEAPALADLHPERDRPDLLRDHPAQGQRRLRRRQLSGAVRIDRERSDEARRPVTMDARGYQSGFGNEHATEALPGALPIGQNSPQRAPYGLYAEQLSGTAFTAPRHANRRSWLYRTRPAAMHRSFAAWPHPHFHNRFDEVATPPNQLRWSPFPLPQAPADFVEGLYTVAGNGGAAMQAGCAMYVYACNRWMQERFFYDADAELVIVPQQGRLKICTELGVLEIEPQQVALIPRGVRFRVELPDGTARGYVCENFGALLRLPDLGPIGSNCLANPRDFEAPCAAYEDVEGEFEVIAKFQGQLWRARIDHSPLDVVAWHGNYAPYRYDLRRFNTIGSISY